MLYFKPAIFGLISIASVARAGEGDGYFNEYCSNENTGGDFQPQYNTYNSMGSCATQCQYGFAFAILQWKSCWCSNYVPLNTVSLSECSQRCPGYPDDTCGDQGQGLYGYVALYRPPIGTSPTSTKVCLDIGTWYASLQRRILHLVLYFHIIECGLADTIL